MVGRNRWQFPSDDGCRLPFPKRGRVCPPEILGGQVRVEYRQHYLDPLPSCRSPVKPDMRHGHHLWLVVTWMLRREGCRSLRPSPKKARCSHGITPESVRPQGLILVSDLRHRTSAPVSEGGICLDLEVRAEGKAPWSGVSGGPRYHSVSKIRVLCRMTSSSEVRPLRTPVM